MPYGASQIYAYPFFERSRAQAVLLLKLYHKNQLYKQYYVAF